MAGCSTTTTQTPDHKNFRTVKATWYGVGDGSGSHTANGEKFKPKEHTAAHKTLPFHTKVTVRNPRNGKKVKVRINDRGPFTKGVEIDLTHGAAEKIGFLNQGKGNLEIHVHKNERTSGKSGSPVP